MWKSLSNKMPREGYYVWVWDRHAVIEGKLQFPNPGDNTVSYNGVEFLDHDYPVWFDRTDGALWPFMVWTGEGKPERPPTEEEKISEEEETLQRVASEFNLDPEAFLKVAHGYAKAQKGPYDEALSNYPNHLRCSSII